MKKIYALVTGLALGLGVLMGSAAAGEKFTLLKNIPAQALSQTEMAQVEGQGWAWSNIGWLYMSPINNYLLPIRPINFQLSEFQAVRRAQHPTPAVAKCPLVILTRVSDGAGCPRRRHS